MGSYWRLAGYANTPSAPEDVRVQLEALFDEIITELSLWDQKSFISILNASPAGTPHLMPTHFRKVWAASCRIAHESGMGFSPLFSKSGDVSDLNFESLTDISGQIVRPEGFQFDLNAVAKGYAIDRAGDVLNALGMRSFLFEIGGDYIARGIKPDKSAYWVEIDPRLTQSDKIRIAVIHQAVATSGQLEQAVLTGDGFSSHIRGAGIDLNDGVTVIADRCEEADGWATALLTAGPAGPELADQLGLAAIFCSSGRAPIFSQAALDYLD